jgi:hypothetical protein
MHRVRLPHLHLPTLTPHYWAREGKENDMAAKKTYNTLHAVVAPKQKKVKIMFGSKLLKVYNFQIDVPSKRVQKEFEGHDYGAWSVSDRDYTYTKEVVEWDAETINKIANDALEYYKQNDQNKPE